MFDWYKNTEWMKFNELEEINNNQLKSLCVNCESSAAGLTNSLFYDIPSLYETSRCEAGCTNKKIKMVTIAVKPQILNDTEFEVLKKHVALSHEQFCSKEGGCNKKVVTAFSQIGNFLAFELYDDLSDSAQNLFALGKIPKKISDPLGGKDLILKEVINYIPSGT